MNKKGDTNTPYFVIGIILAVLVLIAASYWLTKGSKSYGTTISPELRRLADKSCLYKTQQDREIGKNPLDSDNDGLADYCDFCPRGSIKEDRDGDLVSNNCDKEPDNVLVAECKWPLTKDERCVEGATVST